MLSEVVRVVLYFEYRMPQRVSSPLLLEVSCMIEEHDVAQPLCTKFQIAPSASNRKSNPESLQVLLELKVGGPLHFDPAPVPEEVPIINQAFK